MSEAVLRSMVKLTQQVKAGGCASKLPPGSLATVLAKLPAQHDDNLLVGFDTSDDAGVYRISSTQALVQTVDFFTPLVDDPFTFGQIAAANALSDVYAMGGTPVSALALVCFPQEGDLDVLGDIMRGGLSMMKQANCVVVGGHSVRDPEIKFGYAVTGLIDPARIYSNTGARPGDDLILTKPLGTGVITTALKQGKAKPEWVEAAAGSMTTLNREAAEIIQQFDAHGMTDVTGFGLMGHGREMALGSKVTLEIEVDRLQVLKGAAEAIELGAIPGGLNNNRDFAECLVIDGPELKISDTMRRLLYDPQTSGGLLVSIERSQADRCVGDLRAHGLRAARIGRVTEPFQENGKRWAIRLI